MDKKFGEITIHDGLEPSCYDVRVKLSDVGRVVTPKGAPPPSSKGQISYPKEVGKKAKRG